MHTKNILILCLKTLKKLKQERKWEEKGSANRSQSTKDIHVNIKTNKMALFIVAIQLE